MEKEAAGPDAVEVLDVAGDFVRFLKKKRSFWFDVI
jgi:hypothetical protein